MDRRRVSSAHDAKRGPARWWKPAPLPTAVYRELVAALFTMRMPIAGFGILFGIVSALILWRWRDPIVLLLGVSAVFVTILRLLVIGRYHRAGGSTQQFADLVRWEMRYAHLTFVSALLLAGLNVRVLMVHEPLMLTATVSLVFTFGAGVVSRTSCRPRLCAGSLLIAVLPTVVMMVWHAAQADGEPLHAEFILFLAFLLLAVLAMSLGSVRHLYEAMVEQLVTKHDLAKLARFDPLTGLPNRLMLREAFHARLETAHRTGSQLAIHFLDLDGFKAVNDQFGHPAGDEMLQQVARRLLSTIRADDIVFRLGGDEFVVIQGGVSHRDEAELLARRIIKHLSETYVIAQIEMRISVSVGISIAAGFESDLDELVAGADVALYRSKARGKSQLQFWAAGEYLLPLESDEIRRGVAGPIT